MTPQQMLNRIKRSIPILACEPQKPEVDKEFEKLVTEIRALKAADVQDFAKASQLTVLDCLAKRLCPICGEHLAMEIDQLDQRKEYYWCNKNAMHQYELDNETGECDRIPL